MKYQKTQLVEAEQFDGSPEMMQKYHIRQGIGPDFPPSVNFFVKTLEGEMRFQQGDWIATGFNGEHWAIADDIFKRTYEPVDDANSLPNAEELEHRIMEDALEAQREGNEDQKGGLLIALWEIDHLTEPSIRDEMEVDK